MQWPSTCPLLYCPLPATLSAQLRSTLLCPVLSCPVSVPHTMTTTRPNGKWRIANGARLMQLCCSAVVAGGGGGGGEGRQRAAIEKSH